MNFGFLFNYLTTGKKCDCLAIIAALADVCLLWLRSEWEVKDLYRKTGKKTRGWSKGWQRQQGSLWNGREIAFRHRLIEHELDV